VLALSESSLLAVIVSGAPFGELLSRFEQALAELLVELGVGRTQCDQELEAAAPLAIARTENRRLIGALNDFGFAMTSDFEYRPKRSLLERELWLSEYISSVNQHRYPRDLALELLNGRGVR
jgi:hypothetical protein